MNGNTIRKLARGIGQHNVTVKSQYKTSRGLTEFVQVIQGIVGRRRDAEWLRAKIAETHPEYTDAWIGEFQGRYYIRARWGV
jgi:hypothetical protein